MGWYRLPHSVATVHLRCIPLLSLLLYFTSLPHLSLAHTASSKWQQRGLIGYGIEMYQPPCAHACQRILKQSPLSCSTPPVADRWHGGSGLGFDTSPDCFAGDDAYILSLAWCLNQRCLAANAETSNHSYRHEDNVQEMRGKEEDWKVEQFWAYAAVGEEDFKPKYPFSKALRLCGDGPQLAIKTGGPLGELSEVDVNEWSVAEISLRDFAWAEKSHSTYSLLLFASMTGLPIVLTFLCFLASAISTSLERLLLAHLIYPTIISKNHVVLRLLGETSPPTRGQALLVLLVFLLNLLFSLLGYRIHMPSVIYDSSSEQIADLVANRLGVLALANLPAIVLYASRNNPFTRFADWSHTTSILMHRWIAYICVAQVVLHSVIYFVLHLHVLVHKFTQSYWVVGVVGTVTICIMVPASFPFVRKRWYEFFVDTHIVLTFVVLCTSFYHIYFKFEHHWGYENWVYFAGIIWGIERLYRGSKIAANGLRRTAQVLEVDEEYFVANIEDVEGTGMAYLYFPTYGWRAWENHPFSIMASVIESRNDVGQKEIYHGDAVFELVGSDSDSDIESDSEFKLDQPHERRYLKCDEQRLTYGKDDYDAIREPIPMTPITPIPSSATVMLADSERDDNFRNSQSVTNGLSFLIRREQGATGHLFTTSRKLRVLVEKYSTHISRNFSILTTATPNLVCIAGGVGISAILPLIRARAGGGSLGFRTALYFGTRTPGLVHTCGLEELAGDMRDHGIIIHIKIGSRWELDEVVRQEVSHQSAGTTLGSRAVKDVTVVVCGPAGMVNTVKKAVVEANKRRKDGIVRLVEESFHW
ncbi:ferric reductase like transmembrane component-domain-containing protein [Bisporella sp. PMI_857]|nr:ferric reductase like transmembrane component-domain-containing protein [Bisporella sp. PMI_857]